MQDVVERMEELIKLYSELNALSKDVKELAEAFFNMRFGKKSITVVAHTNVYESDAYEYVLVFDGDRFHIDLYNEGYDEYRYHEVQNDMDEEDLVKIFKRLPEFLSEMIIDLRETNDEYREAIDILRKMISAVQKE